MRSCAAEAEHFRGVRGRRAPHNPKGGRAAPRGWRGATWRSAGPDEAVLAFLAGDQGGVDRGGEGGVVELDRDIFGARVLGRLAPARAEFDAVGGDPVVRAALALLGDGLDARLDADVEGADRAGEASVV